jgi:hypothetical protein
MIAVSEEKSRLIILTIRGKIPGQALFAIAFLPAKTTIRTPAVKMLLEDT